MGGLDTAQGVNCSKLVTEYLVTQALVDASIVEVVNCYLMYNTSLRFYETVRIVNQIEAYCLLSLLLKI